MITNGGNTNYIKDIVKIVKRLFVGQAESTQKDTSKQCSIKSATPVYKKLSEENPSTIKAGIFLFGMLVFGRLLPLPANSEALLGSAVITPYVSRINLAFILPLAVMFVSDIFLGFGSWAWFTYSALLLAPFISTYLKSKYSSLLSSWLVWHVLANTGQTYPPFSPEALIFDINFLLSGFVVLVLYDVIQKYLNPNLIYNK